MQNAFGVHMLEVEMTGKKNSVRSMTPDTLAEAKGPKRNACF
jgi:hypothetical protein